MTASRRPGTPQNEWLRVVRLFGGTHSRPYACAGRFVRHASPLKDVTASARDHGIHRASGRDAETTAQPSAAVAGASAGVQFDQIGDEVRDWTMTRATLLLGLSHWDLYSESLCVLSRSKDSFALRIDRKLYYVVMATDADKKSTFGVGIELVTLR